MVAGVHAQFPGHRFCRVSGIDAHHDQVRFAWELAAPDGTVAVAGIDVAALAGDGRLRQVTGFFGEPPEQAAAWPHAAAEGEQDPPGSPSRGRRSA